MEDTQAATRARIAHLNDLSRLSLGVPGALVLTPGIRALPGTARRAIVEKVRRFEFTLDENLYGERHFGEFQHDERRILWKIDYYDRTLTDLSDKPSDPHHTIRVLTIMLAWEY